MFAQMIMPILYIVCAKKGVKKCETICTSICIYIKTSFNYVRYFKFDSNLWTFRLLNQDLTHCLL